VDNGVVKVNLDSEAQYSFTRAAAEHMVANREAVLAEEPALGDKRAYDPPRVGRQGGVGDGEARGAGVRGARLGRTQHRLLIKPRPYLALAAPTAVPRSVPERRAPEVTTRRG
jgi:hypothetical protein